MQEEKLIEGNGLDLDKGERLVLRTIHAISSILQEDGFSEAATVGEQVWVLAKLVGGVGRLPILLSSTVFSNVLAFTLAGCSSKALPTRDYSHKPCNPNPCSGNSSKCVEVNNKAVCECEAGSCTPGKRCEAGACVPDFVVQACSNRLPAPPAGQNCTVTAGTTDDVLLAGDVLVPGKVYQGGHVLLLRQLATGPADGRTVRAGAKAKTATPTFQISTNSKEVLRKIPSRPVSC